ncbi:MAG: DEAD/DEAH box helicase [Chloroflexota bacterium]
MNIQLVEDKSNQIPQQPINKSTEQPALSIDNGVSPTPEDAPVASSDIAHTIGDADISNDTQHTFAQLNLHPQLLQAVTELGYTTPTPIQEQVIPHLLNGDDIIGQAQTGTGKTAAFSLPILQALAATTGVDKEHVQSLVLAPTRELAMQVSQSMFEYGRHTGLRILPVYGGQPYDRQIRRLRKGVDVVVGTPGRLLDLIRQKALDLSHIKILVLDEADEMLSLGFIEDIESILSNVPDERQTALFSATVPPEIRRLAEQYMHDPQSVSIKTKQRTVDTIEQRYYIAKESDKLAALTRLFEMEEITSALIFVKTRLDTGNVANELTNRGFPAEALNGDLSQEAREQVLNRFQDNKIEVLVATDIAARGLDIDHISHVFNYDLPQYPEIYVHRVGRTGRAGKTGIAITLMTPRDQWRLRRIEEYTKQPITYASLPSMDEILAYRDEKLVNRMKVWLRRQRYKKERETVAALMEEGFDAADIAAAALKIARAEEKRRPIAHVTEVEFERRDRQQRGRGRDRDRGGRGRDNQGRDQHRNQQRDRGKGKVSQRNFQKTREEGMVRLSMDAGKADGVRPGDVVGTIARFAKIPGDTIGAIRIQEDRTFVDVPEQYIEQVLSVRGRYQMRNRPVEIERA